MPVTLRNRAGTSPTQPMRRALRKGGDHDLIGIETTEAVSLRLHGVRVADLAVDYGTQGTQLDEGPFETLLGQRVAKPRR